MFKVCFNLVFNKGFFWCNIISVFFLSSYRVQLHCLISYLLWAKPKTLNSWYFGIPRIGRRTSLKLAYTTILVGLVEQVFYCTSVSVSRVYGYLFSVFTYSMWHVNSSLNSRRSRLNARVFAFQVFVFVNYVNSGQYSQQ